MVTGECHYDECHYVECHHAKSHFTEYHYAQRLHTGLSVIILGVIMLSNYPEFHYA